MKQIKTSAVLLLAVALFAVFCLGVLVGRMDAGDDFRIVTERKSAAVATEAPSQEQIAPIREQTEDAPTKQPTEETTEAPTQKPTEPDPYPININTATADELMLLPKIGPTLAERIIAYRENFGPFESTKELDMVEGIGEKIMEDISDLITVEE